MNHLYR
jgi:hypothetical protein